MQTLSLPEVSTAQLVAIVGSIFGVLVAAGLDISADLQSSIINLITVLGPVLIVGDAVIRNGRSRALLNQPKGEVADDGSKGGASA